MIPNLNQPTRKWRRINPYICDKCGKPRYSFIFTRAKERICRSCARNQVPENQQSLFAAIDPPAPNGDYGAEVVGEKKKDGTVEIKSVKSKKPKKEKAPKMTPLEAAKELIRDQVERGESCSAIQASYHGHCCDRYMARISSTGGKIEVEQINDVDLHPTVKFSLKKIYHEILMEKKQHEKCGCDRNKIVKGLNKQALGRGDLETKEIIDVAFPPLGRKKKK